MRERESAPYYRPIRNEVQVFRAAREQRLPVLLKGPTGCGKTRFVEFMAAELDAPLVQVACNEDTTASDLLGRYLLKGGDTIWQDGPVTRAVRAGALLYLDEIAEAREDVIVLLHSLTDHRRELYLDRTNETLKAPSAFQVVISYNPGYQRGMKELKPSLRQRFVALSFNYPSAEIEAEVLAHETGCKPEVAAKLVALARQIRSMGDLAVRETASTRLLVNAAKLHQSGLDLRSACQVGIADTLADDEDLLQPVRDLISLRF